MSSYYLCGIDSARKLCTREQYRKVHYCVEWKDTTYHYYIFPGWRDNTNVIPTALSPFHFVNAIILKNLDKDVCTLLSLADPLFKKVPSFALVPNMDIKRGWRRLYE